MKLLVVVTLWVTRSEQVSEEHTAEIFRGMYESIMVFNSEYQHGNLWLLFNFNSKFIQSGCISTARLRQSPVDRLLKEFPYIFIHNIFPLSCIGSFLYPIQLPRSVSCFKHTYGASFSLLSVILKFKLAENPFYVRRTFSSSD